MKTVITYGTFDMFHIGHVNLLRRARELGDRLIVGVSTDEFNLVKGKKTLMPFEQRSEIIKSIRYVDGVFPEESWEQKVEDFRRFMVDVFVMGEDWCGHFDDFSKLCEVVYLERTENVSTSLLKQSLSEIRNISKEDLLNALEILDQLRKDLA